MALLSSMVKAARCSAFSSCPVSLKKTISLPKGSMVYTSITLTLPLSRWSIRTPPGLASAISAPEAARMPSTIRKPTSSYEVKSAVASAMVSFSCGLFPNWLTIARISGRSLPFLPTVSSCMLLVSTWLSFSVSFIIVANFSLRSACVISTPLCSCSLSTRVCEWPPIIRSALPAGNWLASATSSSKPMWLRKTKTCELSAR